MLRSEDKILLKNLIEFRKLDLYYFHEKYQLSPAQIHTATDRLVKLGIAKIQGTEIVIQDDSIDTALKYFRKINDRPKKWAQVADDNRFLEEKLELFTPKVESHKNLLRR